MTDETKKLFDAPWKRANNLSRNGSGKVRGRSQSRIVDASDRPVAYAYPTGKQKITANRLARLPELYDALNKQAYYRCVDCLRITAKTIDDIPLNKDMIECGCPRHRTDCGAFDVWQLLKKVRDGK